MLRSKKHNKENLFKKISDSRGFKWGTRLLKVIIIPLLIYYSNYYLQLSLHEWSEEIADAFILDWQIEIFGLNCLVLFVFWLFLYGVSGSWLLSTTFYTIVIGLVGFANAEKLAQRLEPVYPDELSMVTELGLMKEMIGSGPFIICVVLILIALMGMLYAIYRSFFLKKGEQIFRIASLVIAVLALFYMSNFNKPGNLVREKYDETAEWISYSQRKNYSRAGFVGGFLYNLKVESMEKPAEYSEKTIAEIMSRYHGNVQNEEEEMPNIIFVMGETFSDPLRLKGIEAAQDPLAAYREIANQTYSGQMLSTNYGGGTANIEFEALTSFSLEPLSPQMTTPYSMLVPKIPNFPSVVSLLKDHNYDATAVHPHNTSMYKRDTVYGIFGFDDFISSKTMKNKNWLENNPYISDASAYAEILEVLQEETPHFIHLVTMQSHNPYDKKYPEANYGIKEIENLAHANGYFKDMEYSSQALSDFIAELNKLERRSLVVYWGDHLPGFYGDDVLEQNDLISRYLTEFLIYDTKTKFASSEKVDNILSPIFFSEKLFELANLAQPGFYKLLGELEDVLPAMEKEFYLIDSTWQAERKLSEEAEAIYQDYLLIMYDIVAGKQYSLKAGFFDTVKK